MSRDPRPVDPRPVDPRPSDPRPSDPRLVEPARGIGHAPDGGARIQAGPETDQPFDPLRLCIFATVALLGWVLGPLALVLFAGLGFVGYWRARRAGLTRSQCLLRDVRLVLAYLAVLVAAGVVGIWWEIR